MTKTELRKRAIEVGRKERREEMTTNEFYEQTNISSKKNRL